jgi:hypothetical protein
MLRFALPHHNPAGPGRWADRGARRRTPQPLCPAEVTVKATGGEQLADEVWSALTPEVRVSVVILDPLVRRRCTVRELRCQVLTRLRWAAINSMLGYLDLGGPALGQARHVLSR